MYHVMPPQMPEWPRAHVVDNNPGAHLDDGESDGRTGICFSPPHPTRAKPVPPIFHPAPQPVPKPRSCARWRAPRRRWAVKVVGGGTDEAGGGAVESLQLGGLIRQLSGPKGVRA